MSSFVENAEGAGNEAEMDQPRHRLRPSFGGFTDVLHVSIPTAKTRKEIVNFTGRSKTHSYTVFVIEVSMVSNISWKVERRYTDFRNLHRTLKTAFKDQLKMEKFPRKKTWTTTMKSSTVEERRLFFARYLQKLVKLTPRPRDVNTFLEVALHAGTMGLNAKEPSIDDFEVIKMIGKGSFGKVYLVRVVTTTEVFAMKVLNKSEVMRRKQVEHTKTERRVMGTMTHPFIVTLRFAFQSANKLYMVSDFCKGGELFFHLKNQRVFTEPMVQFYAAEIVLALAYLHENNVVYRDIKPENVLLDEFGHLRLADFGLSREGVEDPHGATTFCGTPEYLSPEMLKSRKTKEGYGKAVDWWGLGTLIYEMFTGWPPFFDKNMRTMCEKIIRGKFEFPPAKKIPISNEAKDIISRFLRTDPAKRLGSRAPGYVDDIKTHAFFEGINWDDLFEKKVKPPFLPVVKEIGNDLANFDAAFTNEPIGMSVYDQARLPVDEDNDDTFDDFTFNHSNETEANENLWT